MYFVPGGRIGFQRPPILAPLASSWHLLSSDQTFQVDVMEALRINADWDDRFWQPDRYDLVRSGFLSPGVEHRHFRDRRYRDDANYSTVTDVLRDDHWIGQIKVSTSTLGSSFLSTPGGQVARWRGVIDELTASLNVRPSPSPSEALSELRVYLTPEGLNPRLVGDQLILSLVPPATPQESSGIRGSHILLSKLSALPLGHPDEREQNTNHAFAIYKGSPGNLSRSRLAREPAERPLLNHGYGFWTDATTDTDGVLQWRRSRPNAASP